MSATSSPRPSIRRAAVKVALEQAVEQLTLAIAHLAAERRECDARYVKQRISTASDRAGWAALIVDQVISKALHERGRVHAPLTPRPQQEVT